MVFNRRNLNPPFHNILIDSDHHRVLNILYDALSFSANDTSITCRIHLCGHGHSGKSSLHAQLRSVLSNSSRIPSTPTTPPTLHDDMKIEDIDRITRKAAIINIDPGFAGRTKGVHLTTLRSAYNALRDVQFIFYDYGGQSGFRVIHSNFLSAPSSVYVIVLPLWNEQKEEPYDSEKIVQMYSYWLKYIYSVAHNKEKQHFKIPIMTVINRFDVHIRNENTCRLDILKIKLRRIFEHFNEYFIAVPASGLSSDIVVEYDIITINCNAYEGARVINNALKSVVTYLKQEPKTIYPAARLLRDRMIGWTLVMDHDDWVRKASEVLRQNFTNIITLPNEHQNYVINVVVKKSLEALLHCGAMLELPGAQYITSPNKFTHDLLGEMLHDFQNQRNVLSHQELVEQARHRFHTYSEHMENRGIKNLKPSDILKSVHLVIPVTDPSDDMTMKSLRDDDEYFYVIVSLLEEDMPLEASVPLPNASRKLIRTFRLANTKTGMFYPGFFARFFRDVITLENDCDNKVWHNGLDVRMCKLLRDGDKEHPFKLQINISPDGASQDGFRVMVATDERSLWSRDYALEVMEKIRSLLFEKYCQLELVEYCGDKTADEMQWLVVAYEKSEDLQYHTKYWGEYPAVNLAESIANKVIELMSEHTNHLMEQYKRGITTIVEKQNESRASLQRQIIGLGKAMRNISNKNVSRLSNAVKVMLEQQSERTMKEFNKMLNEKMEVLLDEIESTHVHPSIVEKVRKLQNQLDWLTAQPDIPHLVENILTPWLERVRCYFGTAKSSTIDCKLAIDRMIKELMPKIANVYANTLIPLLDDLIRFAAEIRHVRALCDQIPPGTKKQWNLLLKMNSRFQRIHESLNQGQPIEEVNKLLTNVFVLQLSDDLSVIRQSLREPILEDCENQSTQTILDTIKTELSRICKMIDFAKSVGISMLTGLVCSENESPNDIVTEQLCGYMQINDARYETMHSLLMEQAHNIRAIRTMQENVLYSAHDMPLLWGVSAKKDKWYGTKYHLQCICCVCGNMVRGGSTEEEKQQKGYLKLVVKYEWVKDALKVLKVTLQILEIVSRIVTGVPFPAFSTFINVMNDEAMSQELIQRVNTAVKTIQPTLNQAVSTAKDLAEEAQKFVLRGGNHVMDEQDLNIVQQRVTEISLLYVKNIRNLLTALKVSFPPQHCGLQPVKHPEEGNIVWLCQESSEASSNACCDKFLREGRNGLLYYPSFV